MARITKKVFNDLALWMMGFGLVVGIVFPIFMKLIGVPSTITDALWFRAACVGAGLLVGLVNITLAKNVVERRLRILADHMNNIENHLFEISGKNEPVDCDSMNCHIVVDSADAIGDSALAFNHLVDTISASMKMEMSLRNYTQMLGKYLETESLSAQALQMLLEDFEAESGAMFVIKSGELFLVKSKGINDESNLVENSIIREVMIDEEDKLLDFPPSLKLEGVLTTYRPRQVIVKPIKYKSMMLGILLLGKSSEFDSSTVNMLEVFTNGLGLAMHNAITYDQVQRLAAIDSLTSFYNRRFGLIRLREECQRAIGNDGYLGLIMFDVDHFKQVNDTYGHPIGDKILRQIGNITRNVVRDGDVLIRYGGDEFLAVLVGASHHDTLEIAEKLRRAATEFQLMNQNQAIKISLSIGVVSYPDFSCENESDLIDAADTALYSAKEAGRNQVFSAV
ncbi:MAG: sensor domain-containing diguanylate cyclase [Sphaerochaetaceae bacterium]|nr:sensor domain-containing diguanylate cyclase [Sphaerochaetaceae bacterium]